MYPFNQLKNESCEAVGIKGVNGKIYRYHNNIWHGEKLKKYHSVIASKFNSEPRCARKSDYSSITNHLYDHTEDTKFFTVTPIGIAVPSGFIQIEQHTGKIVTSDHSPDHRQRYQLFTDPDLQINPLSRAPMFSNFLYDALHGESMDEQVKLLQEITGSVITGIMSQMHMVAYLKGSGRNGKGVIWRLISKLIPPKGISAISPFMWNKEYYLAGLAGKTLNIVGEFTSSINIPDEIFKSVIGGDLLTGREAYGHIFKFTNTASHLFSGNNYIKTKDHSKGFYSRWLLLNFTHTIPPNKRITNLEEKIIANELPQILGWAIRGAQRLTRNNKFTKGKTHYALLHDWQKSVDTVISFLSDKNEVLIIEGAKTLSSSIYKCYKQYCKEVGFTKPIGRNNFYNRLLNTTITGVKIMSIISNGNKCFKGIRIV